MPYDSFLEERESYIIYLLSKQTRITAGELCQIFNLAPSTIRRELASMEKRGLLLRTHGGAVSVEQGRGEPLERKQIVNIEKKRQIAAAAQQFVHDGDTLAIGSGSTTLELCRRLCDMKGGVVITNSLAAANILVENESVEVRVCSGILDNKTGGIVGASTSRMFDNINIDKVFFGTDALNGKRGATCADILTTKMEHAMVCHARQRILLCDNTKLGRESVQLLALPQQIDTVITDRDADPGQVKLLTSAGVRVVIAD